MGLKHGKYVYVRRKDGFYVKLRLLGLRFKRGGKKAEGYDYGDHNRYIILPRLLKARPRGAVVISEDDLPEEVRRRVMDIGPQRA
ncbi:MAG: DUF5622 domain-containing protein [Desulfurococcaceae archaeon]